VSYLEIVVSYVGAAATKSVVLGLIISRRLRWLVPLRVEHPFDDAVLVLTSVTSARGFIIGSGGRFSRSSSDTAPYHHSIEFSAGASIQSTCSRLLADGLALQPRGLPRQRFSLELLRPPDVSLGLSVAMTGVFLAFLSLASWRDLKTDR